MSLTVDQIIKAKGGTAAFAKAIKATPPVQPATVRMWKMRKRIPRAVWPEVIEAYPDITLEALKAIEAA